MLGADLRGFAYFLEPVRRRRQWQSDAALARLAQARRQKSEWEAKLESLHEHCESQAAQAASAWTTRADPATQARALGYLAALQQRRADSELQIAQLTARLEAARREFAAAQQKLEVLDRHRADTLKAFTTEQHRKSGAQADQDWAAGVGYRAATGEYA